MQSVIAAPDNESFLVKQAQSDAAAFAPIYEFYFPRVYNSVRYRVRDAQLTDDLNTQTIEGCAALHPSMGNYLAHFLRNRAILKPPILTT